MMARISFDETDAKIFRLLFRNKEMSSYQLTKKIYSLSDDYKLRSKEVIIKKKLQKWVRLGIILNHEREGKRYYSLDLDRIIFGKGKFVIETSLGKMVVQQGTFLLIPMGEVYMLVEV